MLTGSNQYLRPDYLSPLPTTLDAKKSPLALLAQTCSNIGADTPSTKPLLPPVDKPKDSDKKSSSVSPPDDKSSFKPYESVKKEESNTQDGSSERTGFRTPTSKTSSSPAVSVSTSHSGSGKVTPSTSSVSSSESGSKVSSSSMSDSSCSTTTVTSAITHPLSSAALHSQHNRISIGCGNMFVEVNHHESALPKDGGLSSHLPLGSYKTSGQLLPPSGMLGSLANCTGCTQVVGPHVDAASSQSFAQLSQKGFAAGSGLSPYVAYARVKTATGGTTLVPICRDPYCTNCQFSVQSAQLVGASSCPSGCTQCTHEKAAAGLAAAAAAAAASPLSSLSLVPGAGGPASAAQLYSHSMLSHRPYVCNWIAGDTYCGKRFGTSEELLQHLRTHTNLSASDAASLPMLNPALSLPSAQSLACHLHYSNAPSLTTMAGLHRTYPTSLSPVGSLSSSRYHPYKPPYPPMPGTPFAPMAPHPGFGPPYYSPYAMYGQRIGAAVHP